VGRQCEQSLDRFGYLRTGEAIVALAALLGDRDQPAIEEP
jgi:hypothetical protein